MTFENETTQQNRRVLNAIHASGSIFYDRNRLEAYSIIARVSIDERVNLALANSRRNQTGVHGS